MSEWQSAFDRCLTECDKVDVALDKLGHGLDGLDRSLDRMNRAVIVTGILSWFIMLVVLVAALSFATP